MDFDGTNSTKEAVSMCRRMQEQGVTIACATPHYYPWREDMEAFLSRRDAAYARLMRENPAITVLPGAEVQIYPSLAEAPVHRMCIGDSTVVMLEMPEGRFADWMIPTIENTVYKYGLTPIIAHLERYGYPLEVLKKFAGLPRVIFQITVGELQYTRSLKVLDAVSGLGVPVVLGSDAHNMSSRPPRFDYIAKTLQKEPNVLQFALRRKQKLIRNALFAQPMLEKKILG